MHFSKFFCAWSASWFKLNYKLKLICFASVWICVILSVCSSLHWYIPHCPTSPFGRTCQPERRHERLGIWAGRMMRMMFCQIDLDSPGIGFRGFVAVELLSFIIMKINESVRRYVSSFDSQTKTPALLGFMSNLWHRKRSLFFWLRGPPPELHLVLAAITGRALRGHGGALSVSDGNLDALRWCLDVACCNVRRTSFDSPCFVNNWHLDWKPWFSSTSLVRRSNYINTNEFNAAQMHAKCLNLFPFGVPFHGDGWLDVTQTQQPGVVLLQAGMDVKEKLQGMICQLFQKHGEDFTSLQMYNLARS